jgi:hypothetical protein
LTESDNVAVLKRRLAPAIAELEAIGFLRPSDDEQRYQKIKPGVWRVHFEKGYSDVGRVSNPSGIETDGLETRPTEKASLDHELVMAFYRLRGVGVSVPGTRDLEQAQTLLRDHGEDKTRALLPHLAAVVRKEWPDCRSLSGAVQKYLPDALKLLEQDQLRQARREDEQARRRQELADEARRRAEQQQFRATWEPAWQALTEPERETVRQTVLARHPHLAGTRALLEEQCLRELARRRSAGE